MDFDGFDSFMQYLKLAIVPTVGAALDEGLAEAGEILVQEAKKKFGVYQKGVYSFSKWKPLADSTKQQRVRQGYSADEPLLRSGKTRDSIYWTVKDGNLIVGSTEETMIFHEFGTKNGEPPRPVLTLTAYQNKKLLRQIIGKATVVALAPELKKVSGFKRIGPSIDSGLYSGLGD